MRRTRECLGRRARRGFTLSELIVSLAVSTLLFGAIASTMVIASHALPDAETPDAPTIAAAALLNELVDELSAATFVSEAQATAVTFQIADRTGDAAAETIRYAWSGKAGDPLVKTVNGATAASVPSVDGFALTYAMKSTKVEKVGDLTTSAETLLCSFTDESGSVSGFNITSSDWPGAYALPPFDASIQSWAVERFRFKAKKSATTDGSIRVQVYRADASGLPTGTLLQEIAISEAPMTSSYGWFEAAYSAISGLPRTQGVAIVLRHMSGGVACTVRTTTNSGGTLGDCENLFSTKSAGTSWNVEPAESMIFELYGRYTFIPTSVVTLYNLSSVVVSLDMPDADIETRIHALNRPETTP